MKNRSKMILGLASMLGISAGAAAVSGFAWFTTQRTAEMSLGVYKVGAGDGSLQLAPVTDSEVNVSSYNVTDHACAITPASGVLADVSSAEGKSFYKAYLKANGAELDKYIEENNTIAAKAWKSKINSNQLVCVRWDVQVSNTTSGTNLNVYLSHNGELFEAAEASQYTATSYTAKATADQTEFNFGAHAKSIATVTVNSAANTNYTPKTDSTGKICGLTFNSGLNLNDEVAVTYMADYSEFYRLAILDVTAGGAGDLVMLYSNSNHAKYVTGTDDTNVEGSGTLTASNYVDQSEMAEITKTTDTAAATTAGTGNQLLIKDLGTTAKTLRFVVWCEGTGTPLEAVKSNAVTSSFELVGLTAA